MKYVTLKQTSLKLSQIGLGCMRIANMTVDDVEKLISGALAQGINFFDHADIYGGGQSEKVFGEALEKHPEWRSQMIIQTKCGIIPGKRYDFSKKHILQQVNQSLENLHTDYVDILLLHRPDMIYDPEELSDAIHTLYNEGKIKYFGVSNHNSYQIALLEKYLKDIPVLINQLQFSIIHSGMIDVGMNVNMVEQWAIDKDSSILDYCRLNDILIQPWSPFQASWADGTFINNPKYEKLNAVLEQLADKYHTNKNAIALAWILKHPANMQPILGTTSLVHLNESLEALDFEITKQEWYDLYLAEGKPLP
ncbi:MAG: aldo/keto reductase [Erysipelotrichaceae bacterium]|nr:aldo/keto reductase [Erysipelotrichaceae bacterium]